MNIGIYIYDNAEVLDFAGPYEVFSTAARVSSLAWNVLLIAESPSPVRARAGFTVMPDHDIANHPKLDLLIIAGGVHTRELEKHAVIEWIKTTDAQTPLTASVCTGAFLLAEAGLLNERTVTTHWEDQTELQKAYPNLNVVNDQRWVSSGKYTTSGGISAGIDMSLELVARITNRDLAVRTARQMEYQWTELAN